MEKLTAFITMNEGLCIVLFLIAFILICVAFAVFGKESKRISTDVREYEALVNAEKSQINYDKAKVLRTEILKNGFNSDAEFDLFMELTKTFERKYLII